jgi:Flp pilus assembly protein TadG
MNLFSRFKNDGRGVAALEFAMIAPVMVLTLFGAVEINDALGAKRKLENTSASIADIVSRDASITDEEIADLWEAATALMFPYEADGLKLRLTAVEIDVNGSPKVVWSEGYNGLSARIKGSGASEVPEALRVAGSTVIMSEAEFEHEPHTGLIVDANFELKHVEYRRPRVPAVERAD